MIAHWKSVQPMIHNFDGRIYHVPDFVACNWLMRATTCSHIKYAYCVHPDLVRASKEHWQYDSFWREQISLVCDK